MLHKTLSYKKAARKMYCILRIWIFSLPALIFHFFPYLTFSILTSHDLFSTISTKEWCKKNCIHRKNRSKSQPFREMHKPAWDLSKEGRWSKNWTLPNGITMSQHKSDSTRIWLTYTSRKWNQSYLFATTWLMFQR